MVIEAAYADGTGAANALHMSQAQWEELQRAYCVGDLLMPCCNAPAIPKVSANGYPFFAHLGGACSTSEESQWHLAAKILVRSVLEDLGCRASVEMPGSGDAGRWQADVWGERNGVRLAVEIQRSYQSLRDYRKRQERYREAGVKSLWDALIKASGCLNLSIQAQYGLYLINFSTFIRISGRVSRPSDGITPPAAATVVVPSTGWTMQTASVPVLRSLPGHDSEPWCSQTAALPPGTDAPPWHAGLPCSVPSAGTFCAAGYW